MQKILAIFGLLIVFSSCSKNKSDLDLHKLQGEWILEYRFYGDVMIPPCDGNELDNIQITMNIQKNKDITWQLNGQSVVNSYFSSFKLSPFEGEKDRFKIELTPVGSTKMAGTKDQMECEAIFFQLLGQALEVKIIDKSLHWGVFPPPNAPPSRNGGTYLIFKKSE